MRATSEPLRYFRLWAAIGWSLVVLIVCLSMGPPVVGPEPGMLWDKAAHLGAYCVLMLWFRQLYHSRESLGFAVGFTGMGVILELLQGAIGSRSFDLLDMFANAAGVMLGWALGASFFAGWLRRAEVWLQKGCARRG